LVEKIDFGNFDIVFSFSNGFAHGIISPSSTIHVNFTSSRNFQKLNSGIFTDVKFRQWDFFAAQRADFHIADCVFTQSEIKKVYKRDSILIYPKQETIEKIAVSNGADFFLTISDDQANYDGLRKTIEIFNKTARRLVVFTDWRQKKNLELICGETIDLVDDFTQEMFYEFLANCRAFLLPDDFDFLLAARAAAYGKPLVAHDQGAAAEFVISNVNGELFFEKSMREIENAIGRLLAKKNVYSSAKIESYAQEFLKKNAVKPLAKFLKSLEK
jgi:glycosyltransferase involved in cell wall biosynthesis